MELVCYTQSCLIQSIIYNKWIKKKYEKSLKIYGEPTFTTSQETDIWEMIRDGLDLEEILSIIRKW
jgi:hypothetical protein